MRGPDETGKSGTAYAIREGRAADLAAIEALLPRLADFEVPPHRAPESLWHDDRDLVRAWAAGERSDVRVFVATANEALLGVAVSSERVEWLEHEPSVHLEVLALARAAEGRGVGTALLAAVEDAARAHGAGSLSLNVFTANVRARALYERAGFDGEITRYFKRLS